MSKNKVNGRSHQNLFANTALSTQAAVESLIEISEICANAITGNNPQLRAVFQENFSWKKDRFVESCARIFSNGSRPYSHKPALWFGLMPIPSLVMIALVAGGTRNWNKYLVKSEQHNSLSLSICLSLKLGHVYLFSSKFKNGSERRFFRNV